MRIAVIADIHANLPGMDAVIRDMKSQSVNSLVFLGDLVMDGTRPSEVFDFMESLAPLVWIKGNNDDLLSGIDRNFALSRNLKKVIKKRILWANARLGTKRIKSLLNHPISQEFKTEGHNLTFCHGSPTSYTLGITPEKSPDELTVALKGMFGDVLICGHTHRRFMMKVGKWTIVNFGAVSIPENEFALEARYGIIEVKKDIISFHFRDCPYDTKSFFKEMVSLNYPGYKDILAKFGESVEGLS